jgi:putative phosphoribosyl transferase
MKLPFADRATAARALAQRLAQMRLTPPVVVLALPRGGVPIGAEVARAIGAELDLVLVRKIGLPWQPELAVAALVDGDPPELVIDVEVQQMYGVARADIESQAGLALAEIARRRERYLAGRAPVSLEGATAVVVDDGIATGTTMRAALKALRKRHPARLVLAVPVAPADTLARLRGEVDELVCLATPEPFRAVGLHYADFHQVGDDEVIAALASARPAPT